MKVNYIHIYRWMLGLGKFTALVLVLLLVFIPLVVLTPTLFTVTTPVYAATTINLGTADNFAVLGSSTVTNTGSSVINGDLGLSPGTSVTGFPPGTLNGTLHKTDATASQAQNDLTTAYNFAVGQPCTQDLTGQNLGGLILTPDTYCFSSSAQLTGTLTLNAQGDPDAVFIFQIGSTLTTASNSDVILTNSGQDCHVFWQIGSSATLGTGTDFIGTIMVLTSATLTTGANVEGRVLAQNGVVTLDTNTITKATCASPTSTPTPTSTSAPVPTPTPTSSSTASSGESSSTGTTVYSALGSTVITPIIIESRRIDADSIFISWGPYSGIDTFNVQYGLENGKWLYNTNVTGFSTTINALSPNQPIWVQVAARNDYSVGIYGESKFVGGPSLPNTGFAPHENNIPWNISVGIGVAISILLVLIQRKHKFLSKQ